jgi:sugar phosphate isomerase/epimerase
MVSRREFLIRSAASVPLLAAISTEVKAMNQQGLQIGSQSYSFREFDFAGSLKCLKELGLDQMEFCSVHFPPNAEDPNFGKVKETLQTAGVKVPCFGVEGFSADAAANRKKFEFAKALGVSFLTADPTPDSFDNLDKLVEEFGIKIAIHNHGPKARYDKVADTLKAVEKHHPSIGACIDTGHSIRSGEKPHEVILALGKRVHSLHLKDWKQGGEEQIIGEGDLDLLAVAKALKSIGFSGPLMFEYENSPKNPVPDMKKGLANWLATWAKA